VSNPASNPARKLIPAAIALVLVAASAGLGIWMVFSDISKPKTVTQSAIPSTPSASAATTPNSPTPASFTGTAPKTFVDPSPANFDKKVFNAASPDAFRKTSENSWSIKGGRLFMQVHRNQAGALVVRYVYPYEDFLPKDTVAMLRTRWIMTETFKLKDEIQMTDEQWEKLNAVKLNTDTQVSGADRKRALELFKEALAAANQNQTINGGQPSVPEEKLTDFVRDLDQKYYDATIANANRLAADVKAIFTDLQLTGLMRRYGTW
jgi:hypothetical protein